MEMEILGIGYSMIYEIKNTQLIFDKINPTKSRSQNRTGLKIPKKKNEKKKAKLLSVRMRNASTI